MSEENPHDGDADYGDLRTDYRGEDLSRSALPDEPFRLFADWFEAARAVDPEANAMVLATVREGRPSARVVLLKGVDSGFHFYTNYASRKGAELADDPAAALTFFWSPLHRQVRVEGTVEKLDAGVSDAYFARRPRGSQLGAWASPQSSVIRSRRELEERLRQAEARFEGTEVPRPPGWGGYRVVPHRVEFWQGRPDRLHDRFAYSSVETGSADRAWRIERLAP